MALGLHMIPSPLDFPLRTDKKRAAHDAQERFPEKLFHTPRAIRFNGLESGITEQREIEFLFLLEACLGLYGIRAHAEDHRAQFIEILLCVTKLGRFDGST